MELSNHQLLFSPLEVPLRYQVSIRAILLYLEYYGQIRICLSIGSHGILPFVALSPPYTLASHLNVFSRLGGITNVRPTRDEALLALNDTLDTAIDALSASDWQRLGRIILTYEGLETDEDKFLLAFIGVYMMVRRRCPWQSHTRINGGWEEALWGYAWRICQGF